MCASLSATGCVSVRRCAHSHLGVFCTSAYVTVSGPVSSSAHIPSGPMHTSPVCVCRSLSMSGPGLAVALVCVLWQLLPVVSTAVGPHLLLCLPVSPSLPPDSSEVLTPLRQPRDSCGVVGV